MALKPVVWAGLQGHHESLDPRVDLPREVAGGHVPRDELVGNAHDVSVGKNKRSLKVS